MIEALAGILGGLIGAAAMFAVRTPALRAEPPDPALLLARISGGDAHDYPSLGTVLQLAYGMLAGAAFAVVTTRAPGLSVSVSDWTTSIPDRTLSVPAWDEQLWIAGLVYGLALAIVGLLFWAPLIGLQERMEALDPGERTRRTAMLVGAHVVYGAILGAVMQIFAA